MGHMYVCACSCVWVQVYICVWRASKTGVLYLKSIPIFCWDKVSLSSNFIMEEVPGICLPLSPTHCCWGSGHTTPHSAFHVGSGDMNLDIHVCKARWLSCVLNLVKSVFFFFSHFCKTTYCFHSNKNYWQIQFHEVFAQCVLLRVYSLQFYVWILHIFKVNFAYGTRSFWFFACKYLVISALLVEKTAFTTEWNWQVHPYIGGFISWILIISTSHMTVFMSVPQFWLL